MHGTIFFELKKYMERHYGENAWREVLNAAGLMHRNYDVMSDYPDTEALTLVGTASRILGKPVSAILEDFGEFIAPDLLHMYGGAVNSSWKTLDVIEHTEQQIHRVVRLNNPSAKPPELKVNRTSEDSVEIDYTSARKMCSVAKGIVRGLARHFNEEFTLSEETCMLKGDGACRIVIQRIGMP